MKAKSNIFFAIVIGIGIFCQGCLKKNVSLVNSPKSDAQQINRNDTPGSGSSVAELGTYQGSMLNFRQISQSLIAMAGITDPMQIEGINREWTSQKTQFSKTGSVEEVTANTMNAAFFLASQVCDYIKSAPGLPINTSATTSTSSPNETIAVTNVSNFYSQKFLGRDLTIDEVSSFINLKRTSGLDTQRLHQMICTIVASSAESLSI